MLCPTFEGALEHLCQAWTERQPVTGSAGCFYLDLWVNLVLSSTLLNLKLLYFEGRPVRRRGFSWFFLHCCPEIPTACGVMMPRVQCRALTEPSLGLTSLCHMGPWACWAIMLLHEGMLPFLHWNSTLLPCSSPASFPRARVSSPLLCVCHTAVSLLVIFILHCWLPP